MFLLGIKVLHAVFPHFLSVVLVHRSATRAFSRVIRFTSLSNTQVRPHSPLQGLQNLIRTSQSLFSNFCGLPVGKIAEKVPPSGNLNGAYMNKYRPTTDQCIFIVLCRERSSRRAKFWRASKVCLLIRNRTVFGPHFEARNWVPKLGLPDSKLLEKIPFRASLWGPKMGP